MAYLLKENAKLVIAYRHSSKDSNLLFGDYTKNRVSIALQWEF
jgi:hypothetical protein